MNNEIRKLAKELKNIGPRNAERLLSVGIKSKNDLKKIGVYEAFISVFEADENMKPHPLYLYALYGAIHDIDWRKIPEEKKEEYKKFTKNFKYSLL